MKLISEYIIDEVAEEIGQSEDLRLNSLKRFQEEQGAVFAYFFSENLEAFTAGEKEYALFLALVIFKSVIRSSEEIPFVSEQSFVEAEDANWEKLQNITTRRFRERMDVFFKDYPQEDLLAFVEDSLIEDEETPITKEGREPLFVLLKTVIDCFTK